MTIYYSVRVKLDSLPAFVDEGKLEALAIVQSHQLKKQEAEELARSCAEHHGFTFDIYKIEERVQGTYRPKSVIKPCEERQEGDEYTCHCGLRWDVKEERPPCGIIIAA